MKAIGKKLQEKRRSLKLSFDDVARATKMPKENIRAIEKGDFDFFKDDITYLRFYLRAYCKYLDIDFDEVKDVYDEELLQFTQTMSLNSIKEHQEIEENVVLRAKKATESKSKEVPIREKRDFKSIRQNAKQGGSRFKTRKLDFSLISLVGIIIVIIVLIIVVVFSGLLSPSDNKQDTGKKDNVVEEQPTPEKEEPKKDDEAKKEEEKKPTITISEVAADNYQINGTKANEALKIEVRFTARSWFQGTSNNATLAGFDSTVYEAGTSAIYNGTVQTGSQQFLLSFGAYKDGMITIWVNDVQVPLNNTLGSVANITLTINGE